MARGQATEYGPVLWRARAGLDRSGMWGLVAVVFGCLLAVPYQVARQPDAELGQRVLVIGLTYLIVGAVIVTVLGILNATFQVTPTHVVKRRVLRPAIVVPRQQIAEAVLTPHYAVFGNHRPRAILVDRDTAPLLTSAPLREMADLEGLAQAAPSVTRVPVLTAREATQRWPRMLPWSHRNPAAGVALGFGVVVLCAAVAAVLVAWLVP